MELGNGVTAEMNSERTVALVSIPANYKFLEGHFPNNPIVPAFAIIEISLELARKNSLFAERLRKLSNAKFLAALRPGDELKVTLSSTASSLEMEWQQKQGLEWKKASELSFLLT